ncbi:hypothetical protein ACE1TH_13770 [Shouchella sp. JSM 1781072]|uniref:hypothetical protein n=1 Tax=Shouchella sp. JSM 1781072 TaxID=3344581 RepID=UPI0035C25202
MIEYIQDRDFSFYDGYIIYAVFANLTGLVTGWHLFYHRYYKYRGLDTEAKISFKQPKLFMDTLNNFFLEVTMILTLLFLLIMRLNPEFFDFVVSEISFSFRSIFMYFGIFFSFLMLVTLLISGLSIIDNNTSKNKTD